MYPIFLLFKKLIPIVPNIKRGPELLVKANNLSASSLVNTSFSFKLTITFAPAGYPQTIPIINAIAPSPGTLNNFPIIFFKYFPAIYIIFVLHKSSVATKKGNKLGTTDVIHRASPYLAASKLVSENIISVKINTKHKTVKKYFFTEITIKLLFVFIIKSPIIYIFKKIYFMCKLLKSK